MPAPILKIKITTGRINKEHLYKGQKGTYLDVALFENANGQDQYGNDGFVTQEITKEAREAGEKGPIIGNWRYLQKKPAAGKPTPAAGKRTQPDMDEMPDDIPF